MLQEWLRQRQWTPEAIKDWQTFYDNASRLLVYGFGETFSTQFLPHLPEYQDLNPPSCKKGIPIPTSSARRENLMVFSVLISFLLTIL